MKKFFLLLFFIFVFFTKSSFANEVCTIDLGNNLTLKSSCNSSNGEIPISIYSLYCLSKPLHHPSIRSPDQIKARELKTYGQSSKAHKRDDLRTLTFDNTGHYCDYLITPKQKQIYIKCSNLSKRSKRIRNWR